MEFLFKRKTLRIRNLVIPLVFACIGWQSFDLFAQTNDSEFKEHVTENVVAAFQSHDLDKIEQSFSLEALGHKVAPKLFEQRADINGFVQGFTQKESKKRFIASSFGGVLKEGTEISYRSLREMNGETFPLIRLDIAGGGHEYILLDVILSGPDKGKIQDMFVASSGKWSSESIAGASKLLLIKDVSLLQKFFGNIEINEDLAKKFEELGELRASAQYGKAYKTIMALPEAVRKDRAIIDVAIQLGQLYREDAYYFQLSELAKYYGDDPSTQFILVDHHYIQGDFVGAHKSIDQVINLFGADGAMYNLKANIAFGAQDVTGAIRYSQQAIESEPTFAPAYWTLLTLQSSQNAFSEMVDTLTKIESNLGLAFSENDFQGNSFYTAFIQSEAFKAWFASKN